MPRQVIYLRPAHRTAPAMPTWGPMPPGLVRVPDPPPGLSKKERERIERQAHQAVKRGYRRRAEDYPTPPWIARSGKRREYYLARLTLELALREGYK